jgi:phosphate transport system permease protein
VGLHARESRPRLLLDRVLLVTSLMALLIPIAALVVLFGDVLSDALPRLSWDFVKGYPSRFPELAGVLPALIGTLCLMLVTAVLAIPAGISAAIYLEEYAGASRFARIIEINIANLAGVPSIIYGLMALGLLVGFAGLGYSILAGGLTLAFLILPIVIVATREALRAIPNDIREAAYALGSTKWQVIRHHILPYSAGGIATGTIIAMSRAIGETAPLITIGALTFIAFLPPSPVQANAPFFNLEWLDSPFTVLPIQMFNWISRPTQDFHVNAAATGLVLIAMTLGMNALALVVRYKSRRQIHW